MTIPPDVDRRGEACLEQGDSFASSGMECHGECSGLRLGNGDGGDGDSTRSFFFVHWSRVSPALQHGCPVADAPVRV